MKLKAPAVLFSLFSSLFLAALFHPSALNAEIIKLKNGNSMEAKILRENEEFVVVEAPGGKVKIPKRDIKTILREPPAELPAVRDKE